MNAPKTCPVCCAEMDYDAGDKRWHCENGHEVFCKDSHFYDGNHNLLCPECFMQMDDKGVDPANAGVIVYQCPFCTPAQVIRIRLLLKTAGPEVISAEEYFKSQSKKQYGPK